MSVLKRKDYPRIDAMLKVAFPKYRKHSVIMFDHGSVTNHGSQWDGGSRTFTSLFNKNGSGFRNMPGPTAPPQFGGGPSNTVKLDDDTIAIASGTFRGKPSTVSIYATPATAEWLMFQQPDCIQCPAKATHKVHGLDVCETCAYEIA